MSFSHPPLPISPHHPKQPINPTSTHFPPHSSTTSALGKHPHNQPTHPVTASATAHDSAGSEVLERWEPVIDALGELRGREGVKADEAMEGVEAMVAAEGVGEGGFDGAGAWTVGGAEGGGEGPFDGDGALTVEVSEGSGGWGDDGNAGGVAIADRMGEMAVDCDGGFGW
ncbi:hypothetical protein G7Y79_00007g021050 [Physcia stellaris]|nr:hypothetical protein G7Y79_00007g021050 [Physcia stellaris]